MAGFLAGLGAGLQDLGQGLTQYQMRKLAEEEQQRKEARQREQDALAQAAMSQDEFMDMDKANFKRVGNTKNKGDYNALLALSAGNLNPKAKLGESTSSAFDGDRVTGAISGDEYTRGAGQSPNDQARMLKELAEQNKREIAAERTRSAAALLEQRQGFDWQKFTNTSAEGNANRENRTQNLRISVDGAGARAETAAGGANSRAENALDQRNEAGRINYIQSMTKPVSDGMGGFAAPMSVEDAQRNWEAMHRPAGQASVGTSHNPAQIAEIEKINQMLMEDIQELRRNPGAYPGMTEATLSNAAMKKQQEIMGRR